MQASDAACGLGGDAHDDAVGRNTPRAQRGWWGEIEMMEEERKRDEWLFRCC